MILVLPYRLSDKQTQFNFTGNLAYFPLFILTELSQMCLVSCSPWLKLCSLFIRMKKNRLVLKQSTLNSVVQIN